MLSNPYDSYFTSEGTFRDLQIDDDRLPPKEDIFSFWLDGRAYAVTHRAAEGGKLYEVDGRTLLFYREPGTSFYASSSAYILDTDQTNGRSAAELAARLAQGDMTGAERLNGFDTFWYSWVAINKDSQLLD